MLILRSNEAFGICINFLLRNIFVVKLYRYWDLEINDFRFTKFTPFFLLGQTWMTYLAFSIQNQLNWKKANRENSLTSQIKIS